MAWMTFEERSRAVGMVNSGASLRQGKGEMKTYWLAGRREAQKTVQFCNQLRAERMMQQRAGDHVSGVSSGAEFRSPTNRSIENGYDLHGILLASPSNANLCRMMTEGDNDVNILISESNTASTTPISLSPSLSNRETGDKRKVFFQEDGESLDKTPEDLSLSHSPPGGVDNPDFIKPLLESVHRRLSAAASIDSGDVILLVDHNKTEKCLNIADETQDELKFVVKYTIPNEDGICVVDSTSTALCGTQVKSIAKGGEATLSIDDVSKADSKRNSDKLFTDGFSKTNSKGDGGKTQYNADAETDSIEEKDRLSSTASRMEGDSKLTDIADSETDSIEEKDRLSSTASRMEGDSKLTNIADSETDTIEEKDRLSSTASRMEGD